MTTHINPKHIFGHKRLIKHILYQPSMLKIVKMYCLHTFFNIFVFK